MIAGLQKMTLLDYPGKVACTVFFQGCNFRCPFCHNSGLLDKEPEQQIPSEELLAFLKKRVGLLDGVCVTGGEPTLDPELPRLLREIKALGYAVKLDTNGSRPEVMKALAEQGLIDYVAMDIKNGPAFYGETVGIPALQLTKVEESIRWLLAGNIPYEFRTTVAEPLHSEKSIQAMVYWLQKLSGGKKAEKFFLQPFVDRDSVLC
ncbi:MAG: anaerobic ribonucleoside-triphosphate reductase activating protein, partial [Oscillospiraceae bacterium]|nr:anaerobic ribonucleoside-triphosphate reductase activating protein [Oscillospiraceae bacterium]